MKTYSIIFLIAVLAVTGGCSSAYRSGQTPDAVYYSPARESAGPASPDRQQVAVAQDNNPDAGQYITYDDGDNSSYAGNDYDDYYTQRINMFDRPGSLFAFNNYYGLGGPGLGYYGSPYLGYYSSPYLSIGNPFMWSYPFLSLGLNFGSPWGGWYSPMYSYMGYSPYYAGYLHGYMTGYYGGGYGYGGYYGKVISRTPRPAVSYAPRRTVSSRAATTGISETGGTPGGNVSSPRRVFRTTGNTSETGTTTSHPRRVFRSSPGEHPVNVNTPTRTAEKPSGIRIFRRSNTTTTNRSSNNNNRVETYRPRQETRVVQPRTFERNTRSTPSFNSSTESHSAPVRTFSPRGRR